jgi:hypothetical protein
LNIQYFGLVKEIFIKKEQFTGLYCGYNGEIIQTPNFFVFANATAKIRECWISSGNTNMHCPPFYHGSLSQIMIAKLRLFEDH